MINEFVSKFAERVCEIETEKDIYVRIKQGKTRKRSDVVISGIEVIDAGSLADELESRLSSLRPDPEEKIYVEAMQKGSSQCFDCLHLKPEDLFDRQDEELGGYPGDAMGGAFTALAATVERLALSSDARCSQAQERLLSALTSILELQAIGIEAETRLDMASESQEKSAMSEAAAMFGPLIPIVVDKLGAGKSLKPAKTVEEPQEAIAPIVLKSLSQAGATQAPVLPNETDNAVDLSTDDPKTTI